MSDDTEQENSKTQCAQQEPIHNTYKVDLNIPKFNEEEPELWFKVAEIDFQANRVTNDLIKYSAILKALPYDILKQLTELLDNTPTTDKYKTLKAEILNKFSKSRNIQIHQLLRGMTLGDKKPSDLLREMRSLARNSMGEEVIHQLWTERLPSWIHPYLAITEELDLNSLAKVADRILLTTENNSIFALHTRDTTQNINKSIERQLIEMQYTLKTLQNDMNSLKLQQDQFEKRIENLTTQNNQRQRSRNRSRTPTHNGFCYYHRKWGNNARSCTTPCTFKSNSTTSQEN